MNTNLDEHIYSRLKPGETVLWSGRPGPLHAAKRQFWAAALSIPWLAIFVPIFGPEISLSSVAGLLRNFDGNPIVFMSILFLSAGFLAAISPFWAYFNALNTVYAITDRRILQIGGFRIGSRSGWDFSGIFGVSNLKLHKDGTGSVNFGSARRPNILIGIRDPQSVASLINERVAAQARGAYSSKRTVSNSAFGYTVEIPSDWETGLSGGEENGEWSDIKIGNAKGAAIRIATKEGPHVPFDQALAQIQTIVRSPLGKLISSSDDLNINGYNGYEFTYTMLKGMQIRQVILFGRTRQYHFAYSAPVNIFPLFENVFSGVLDSFSNDRDRTANSQVNSG